MRQFHFAASEVILSGIHLVNVTATTLSITWSADYPKCYSFTVSHSTQDGSITVTQPADSDSSHTLTSLQPGTTYRIEVEAMRKETKQMDRGQRSWLNFQLQLQVRNEIGSTEFLRMCTVYISTLCIHIYHCVRALLL